MCRTVREGPLYGCWTLHSVAVVEGLIWDVEWIKFFCTTYFSISWAAEREVGGWRGVKGERGGGECVIKMKNG